MQKLTRLVDRSSSSSVTIQSYQVSHFLDCLVLHLAAIFFYTLAFVSSASSLLELFRLRQNPACLAICTLTAYIPYTPVQHPASGLGDGTRHIEKSSQRILPAPRVSLDIHHQRRDVTSENIANAERRSQHLLLAPRNYLIPHCERREVIQTLKSPDLDFTSRRRPQLHDLIMSF